MSIWINSQDAGNRRRYQDGSRYGWMMPLDNLNSILTRYQNHVGAYDKAKWEQSIEERILHGINHIATKQAKIGTDLIDLDLVQGSSFPKAKPKHGLFTVTRHALLRLILLPLYHEWWSAQTSPTLFFIFSLLYAAQIFNLALYVTQPPLPTPANPTDDGEAGIAVPTIGGLLPLETSDILSPFVLMLILTILHSQIVSTHWAASRRLLPSTPTPTPTSTNRCSPRREPKPKRRNSFGSKIRKTRRSARVPARRRTNITLVGNNNGFIGYPTLTPQQPPAVTQDVHPPDGTHLIPISRKAPSTSSLSPSTSKKVLFVVESRKDSIKPKSLSASNSDKDEGIPEEIPHELHPEEDSCGGFSMAPPILFCDTVVNRNISDTVSAYVEEQNRCLGLGGGGCESNTNADSNSGSSPKKNLGTTKATSSRCSLRQRNLSKHSASTSSPSGSAAEWSSEKESSSDEENPRQHDDDLDEEDGGSVSEPVQPTGTIEFMVEDEEEVRKSEWTAVTTNSEDDDYVEEEVNNSDDDDDEPSEALLQDDPFAWESQKHGGKHLSPSCVSSDKVSCTLWEGNEAKKADLSVLDISALIIAKVERAKENSDYLYLGICFSFILAFLPLCWRLNFSSWDWDVEDFDIFNTSHLLADTINSALGEDTRTRVMIGISSTERLCLSLCVFFLLAVAEKTYKQRFLYAKLFSRITSTRKSKKSGIPHFRLNKVRNIKTWLSIRSYLQKRGPQRSVDTIVSATFIATLILITFLSVELLKESSRLYYLYNLEVIGWTLCLGFYLMRFMTLGSRVSQKYRNLSVIITEQLNLYLKMEQKPHKKEELLVANNVLKLASELLKELEDPFKISSFATNPYFYNVTRLVILSAFSGVLSEILGFKLKLYKIKLK